MQRGVSLPPPRSDQPRMQYQHGGSRSRMPPFARGGAYSRGQKQFYAPPPPPPPPHLQAAAPPPLNKYEVLMEAGRLAAEYLVAKGVLPAASLQRGGGVGAVGWSQLPPPPPPPPLSAAQEAPVRYDAKNGRRRGDDEYGNGNLNARSRRNRGGDYNGSNRSSYNGRGKRKFGADNKYSDWGRDRDSSRGYSESRSYDEDDEDGAPGFRRKRRGSGGTDEVGSSVSGVAGEGPPSKMEATGESELEDTGSKVSSNSNVRQNVDDPQEVEGDNEANKMQEDSKVSNSEVVEQSLNGESNTSKNASSGVVQEAGTEHSPVASDERFSDEKPEDSNGLEEKAEDDKASNEQAVDDLTSDEKVSAMEKDSRDDSRNLLNYCSFARIPTRPRSVLARRNAGPVQREDAVAEQVDLVSSEEVHPIVVDGAENGSSTTNIQAESKDDLVCQEHADPSTACNQVAELATLHENETQGEIEEMRENNNTGQHFIVQDNKEQRELSPSLAPCQNRLKWQVEKGVQIYNLDTPPQDEELIDSSDKGTTVGTELLPNINAEAVVTMEEEKLAQSSSFKIRDLNLVGSPEVSEIRNDPSLGQWSMARCLMQLQDKQQVDLGTTVGNNASNTDSYTQIPLGNKAVQVIDIEDDSPIEASACDTSKVKSEMIYPSMENMMNPPANTEVLHGIQDGYNLGIPDYLGADMQCYQSLQTNLQAGMGINNSAEGITVMDDPIYGSLSDIGFMEVWDQPSQDYEKFF